MLLYVEKTNFRVIRCERSPNTRGLTLNPSPKGEGAINTLLIRYFENGIVTNEFEIIRKRWIKNQGS
jgi:hypothetical protein